MWLVADAGRLVRAPGPLALTPLSRRRQLTPVDPSELSFRQSTRVRRT